MRKIQALFLLLSCMVLLFGTSCQRHGMPCPKPTSKRTAKIQGADGLQAIQVNMDKNGRVKKRN
ncbi:hypothetical protein [Pontibacter akesuensis]|uniref:Uncharacterized protein n=1 Tax=Pontibacter akesuensis TaxID=388950 RepID=A0A1I7HQP0_9BACT|nr:hypothetical protein [Pontibacter akesuensis]GHA63095.1 hypothetical protein GCM10007389_14390 [Pontibacter akesuensis]SFU63007.1 hypothetical protein SAMN04487941_1598 [Pontibacter akesuensis]